MYRWRDYYASGMRTLRLGTNSARLANADLSAGADFKSAPRSSGFVILPLESDKKSICKNYINQTFAIGIVNCGAIFVILRLINPTALTGLS